MTLRRSTAQALVWFTLVLPVFVSIVGLTIDGGVLLSARHRLQSVADGAARAGATRLDIAQLRSSPDSDVQLDPHLAMDAAQTYVDEALALSAVEWDSRPRAEVEIGARRVRVSIHASTRTAFLRIVHIESVPLQASAFADAQFGIHDGGGN